MSMCKVLVVGDPHFKTRQIYDAEILVSEVIRVTREEQPTIVIILGDVLDRHETIHVTPLTLAVNFFKELAEMCPVYVIIGNHDRKTNREFLTEEHPFVAMKGYPNIHIVDKTLVSYIHPYGMISHDNDDGNYVKMTFVPYVSPGRFMEALNTVDNWQDSTVIFCHQEFKGCDLGGVVSKDGDEVNIRDIQLISGHIHTHQILGNLFYTGTPMQVNFGESEDKAIYMFTFESNKNYTGHGNETKIKLYVHIKRKIILTPDTLSRFKIEEGVNYKIIITGDALEMKGIQKHPSVLMWKKMKIPIAYNTIIGGSNLKEESIKYGVKFTDLFVEAIKQHNKKDDLLDMYATFVV